MKNIITALFKFLKRKSPDNQTNFKKYLGLLAALSPSSTVLLKNLIRKMESALTDEQINNAYYCFLLSLSYEAKSSMGARAISFDDIALLTGINLNTLYRLSQRRYIASFNNDTDGAKSITLYDFYEFISDNPSLICVPKFLSERWYLLLSLITGRIKVDGIDIKPSHMINPGISEPVMTALSLKDEDLRISGIFKDDYSLREQIEDQIKLNLLDLDLLDYEIDVADKDLDVFRRELRMRVDALNLLKNRLQD